MALFIREQDVQKVITMDMTIAAVEEAMKEHTLGAAYNTPRERTRIRKGALHILQGAVESHGVFGYKAYTSTKEGNRFLVYLYNVERGNLEAIIEANYMGMMRTGAANGVAARWMSRQDSSVVGLFGAGWQANGQIEALCRVRPIKKAKVMDLNKERLATFCRSNEEKLGIEVTPAATADEAVIGSDIVTTVTTSPAPLFSHNLVGPGLHINAAGSNALIRTELDERTLLKAHIIAVDSRDVAAKECGDLLPLLEKGRIHWNEIPELGDIIAGRVPGREQPDQITIFESHGMGIQDLAIGARVLAAAREKGLGTEVPIGA
ncbi:MAG: ornithine cyclodeaminase family protein [Deltaproteobacteria bacterium]|nr:ornithine cyclodeaminase family protein [Deltaproteobacteria bacterium]